MPRINKGEKGQIGRSIMKAVESVNHSYMPKNVESCKFVKAENNILKTNKNLSSCIDQGNLDDFLTVVELENKQYEGKRGFKLKNDAFSDREVIIDVNRMRDLRDEAFNVENNKVLQNLRIPRKPKWTKDMKKDELNHLENMAFVEWRKSLAKVEESNTNIQITPYEKNIEVWKQLWRVIERSDIIVQIVDGRDPLFYRCMDLESYSKELSQNKLNFLLVNKSDLLSEEVRREWSTYFNEHKIDHLFFSALQEQARIDSEHAEEVKQNLILTMELNLNEDDGNDENKLEKGEDSKQFLNTHKICNRQILKQTLKRLVRQIQASKQQIQSQKESAAEGNEQLEDQLILDQLTEATSGTSKRPNKTNLAVQVGMVGYPNVGKSSVINTLCNKKLVGVGSLPGKTKNYQTHFLEDDFIVCDCPGLVFPNAASTRSEMICNGVLPVDKIKDYMGPLNLIVSRIPKIVFEKIYKLKIDVEQPDGEHVLRKFAQLRGFYTGSAQPDLAKSAKLILKDLLAGKLLFVKLPPNLGENTGIWQSNPVDLKAEHLLAELEENIANESEKTKALEIPENVEALQVHEEEKKLDEMLKQEAKSKVKAALVFEEEDVVMLLVGKKVHGIKLNKQQKRDIKNVYERGQGVDMSKYLTADQIEACSILQKLEKLN